MRALTVIGTRPEAIKLAPVVWELRRRPGVESVVCLTAQHREMLDQMIGELGISADYDLDLMRPGQTLDGLAAAVMTGVADVIKECRPDVVVVQGDTCTAFVAGLSAFYNRVPVVHVEAGLRTGDLTQPWPEEGNRRLLGQISAVHFAPTSRAAANLIAEGIPASMVDMCGNTVVDTLLRMRDRLDSDSEFRASAAQSLPPLPSGRQRMLVTMHRRENFGEPVAAVCHAILRLVENHDLDVLLPIHPNPAICGSIQGILGHHDRIHLVQPLDYPSFVLAMRFCHLILSDSGGVQEEASTFGKPLLVLRETSERMEAVEAGAAKLVGTDEETIVREANALLTVSPGRAGNSAPPNLFGDGQAARRIVDRLWTDFGGSSSGG